MSPSAGFFSSSMLHSISAQSTVLSFASCKFQYAFAKSNTHPNVKYSICPMGPPAEQFPCKKKSLLPLCNAKDKVMRKDRKYAKKLLLFDLVRVIGQGSYGTVVLSRLRDQPQRLFAIKIITKDKLYELQEGELSDLRDSEIERIEMEGHVMAQLDHPFVTKLYGSFETLSAYHFVMEYCAGGDFYFLLDRFVGNRLPERYVVFYGACLALALQHLHEQGIIYRDLKPENILLDEEGFLRLTDFGFAKYLPSMRDDCCTTLCGSADYVAPEVIRGEGYGLEADCWSMGCVLFELLTGYPPFYCPSNKQNQQKLFHCIQTRDLSFPEYVSPCAQDLLQKLLIKDDTLRMSISEMRKHPFFVSINWKRLYNKQIEPPVVPSKTMNSPLDTCNFEQQYTQKEVQTTLTCAVPLCDEAQCRMGRKERYMDESKLFDGFDYYSDELRAPDRLETRL